VVHSICWWRSFSCPPMNLGVFGVNSSALFQVYASVYDTSDRHRRPTMCTATSTWLVAALPVGPAGLAGVFRHLGVRRVAWPPGCPPACWAGSTSARKTDRPRRFVQEQTEDLLVPPLLRICLTFITFPFSGYCFPLQNSGPCDSFDYLGHSKNVDDDDDDDEHRTYTTHV